MTAPMTPERRAEIEAIQRLARTANHGSLLQPEFVAKALAGCLTEINRLNAAIVEARRRLAKGRVMWNGPCHEADWVLADALGLLRYEARYLFDANSDTEPVKTFGRYDTIEEAKAAADALMTRADKPTAWVVDRLQPAPVNQRAETKA